MRKRVSFRPAVIKCLLFSLVLIVLLSCALEEEMPVLYHVPSGFETYQLDFTPYTNKGFLFTPRSYSGKYNSVGLLEFDYNTEANLVEMTLNELTEEARNAGLTPITCLMWEVEDLDYQVVLDYAYRKALQMGGDAIVSFKLTADTKTLVNPIDYPSVEIPVVHVSGFVIKRHYPYHTEPLPDEPEE